MRNWKKETWSESPHTGNWLCGIFLESNDPLKMHSFLAILFLYTSVHHMFSILVVGFSPLRQTTNHLQKCIWKPKCRVKTIRNSGSIKTNFIRKISQKLARKKIHIVKCWTCLTLFFFDLHFFPFAISGRLHANSRWYFYFGSI